MSIYDIYITYTNISIITNLHPKLIYILMVFIVNKHKRQDASLKNNINKSNCMLPGRVDCYNLYYLHLGYGVAFFLFIQLIKCVYLTAINFFLKES